MTEAGEGPLIRSVLSESTSAAAWCATISPHAERNFVSRHVFVAKFGSFLVFDESGIEALDTIGTP